MSETDVKNARELQGARHRYRQFLKRYDACPTVCLGRNDPDCNEKGDMVKVDPADALDCYLREHPPDEQFREDLPEVHAGVHEFLFKKEPWKKDCCEGVARGDS